MATINHNHLAMWSLLGEANQPINSISTGNPMKDNPLAYALFLVGTIGGVLDFSADLWLTIAGCFFMWLLIATYNQSTH